MGVTNPPSGRTLHSTSRTPLATSFNSALDVAEQEVAGLRVSLPIIGQTCKVEVDLACYLSTSTGNNTIRIRVGTSTTYLSNAEQDQVYIGGSKTLERLVVTAIGDFDLSTQHYVVISTQTDVTTTSNSISASGNRSSVIVRIYS